MCYNSEDYYPHYVLYFSANGKVDKKTNLALGKKTWQISTLGSYNSSKAVDGNTDGILSNGSCTHTVKIGPAWWQVDLQAVYKIGEVAITARNDTKCKYEWLIDFDQLVIWP